MYTNFSREVVRKLEKERDQWNEARDKEMFSLILFMKKHSDTY